jgi:diketogulonate reductase-like aldo/keto reductase
MAKRAPTFLYGTAWKEHDTERCVVDALAAGFRGIDTANQRKHYHEEGVGRGIAKSGIPRDELFIQTKFTHIDGQDQRLPYDPKAPVATQVAQSFDKSLEHLGVTFIDSLVLHGPTQYEGLGPDDHAAWRAMEQLVERGGVGVLGASNVSAAQIQDLVAFAKIKPVFIQNRCYAKHGWDRAAREVCKQHGITYQGFSLLTANRQVLAPDKGVVAIAKRYGKTPAQLIFRFAQQIGMLPLTGTTDAEHMRQDLAIADITLTPDELATIERSG